MDPCATGDLFLGTVAGGAVWDDINIVISLLILLMLDSIIDILESIVAMVCASDITLISSFYLCW